MNNSKTRHQQRGATALGMIVILAIIGLAVYAAVRLVPIYLEYFEVVNSMEKVAKENPAAQSNPDKLRTGLNRHWAIEDIKTLDYNDIEIRKVGSTYEMTADYRTEVPYIANVSLLVEFYKTVTVE